MKLVYVVFIVISAFFHALYNYLMRRSSGNRLFLLGMFISASAISILFAIFFGHLDKEGVFNVIIIYLASAFYVLYQYFVSRAYEKGEISKVYPLTVLSPVFIPIWAFLILDEQLSLMSITGIIIAISGAFLIKLNNIDISEMIKVFKLNKKYMTARFALIASLMYSIGSVLDKAKIASFSLPVYVCLILSFMTVNMFILFTLLGDKTLSVYSGGHNLWMILGGLLVFLSFISFRVALKDVPVSIAVPVRQTSIVFATVFGICLLKEKLTPNKLFGSFLIILGVYIVNLGV